MAKLTLSEVWTKYVDFRFDTNRTRANDKYTGLFPGYARKIYNKYRDALGTDVKGKKMGFPHKKPNSSRPDYQAGLDNENEDRTGEIRRHIQGRDYSYTSQEEWIQEILSMAYKSTRKWLKGLPKGSRLNQRVLRQKSLFYIYCAAKQAAHGRTLAKRENYLDPLSASLPLGLGEIVATDDLPGYWQEIGNYGKSSGFPVVVHRTEQERIDSDTERLVQTRLMQLAGLSELQIEIIGLRLAGLGADGIPLSVRKCADILYISKSSVAYQLERARESYLIYKLLKKYPAKKALHLAPKYRTLVQKLGAN